MSLGYAERLSFREDLGGRLGDPEILEQAQEVLQKVEQLTDLVSSCANRHYWDLRSASSAYPTARELHQLSSLNSQP